MTHVMGLLVALGAAFAADASAWKLAWSDEFDGAALDTKRWNRCGKGGSDWNRNMSLRAGPGVGPRQGGQRSRDERAHQDLVHAFNLS